jgi:hypothetical protein
VSKGGSSLLPRWLEEGPRSQCSADVDGSIEDLCSGARVIVESHMGCGCSVNGSGIMIGGVDDVERECRDP